MAFDTEPFVFLFVIFIIIFCNLISCTMVATYILSNLILIPLTIHTHVARLAIALRLLKIYCLATPNS